MLNTKDVMAFWKFTQQKISSKWQILTIIHPYYYHLLNYALSKFLVHFCFEFLVPSLFWVKFLLNEFCVRIQHFFGQIPASPIYLVYLCQLIKSAVDLNCDINQVCSFNMLNTKAKWSVPQGSPIAKSGVHLGHTLYLSPNVVIHFSGAEYHPEMIFCTLVTWLFLHTPQREIQHSKPSESTKKYYFSILKVQ